MKQIFKYILIFTSMMLAISSCQEEMEAPGGEETVVVDGSISSVSQQLAAVKSTAADLDSYYEALSEDFLPEFVNAVNSLDTSADQVGSVTAAIKSIMSGLNAAQDQLKAQIESAGKFAEANSDVKDLYEMTQATMHLHSQLSEDLAEVTARVDAVMTFVQILAAEDQKNVAPVYNELYDKYDALQVKKISKVKNSLNSMLGKGILPNYYDKARQNRLVEMLKDEMEQRLMVFRFDLQMTIDAVQNPEAEIMSEEEFGHVILTAISSNDGKLSDEASSQIAGYNTGINSHISTVNTTFRMFKSVAVETVTLLAPVQSIVFMSTYAENIAYARYSTYGREDISLTFKINGADGVADAVVADWATYMTLQAFDPAQGATLMDTPPTIKSATLEGDELTVVVDPTNVPQSLYNGSSVLNLILDLTNGVKKIATEDLIQLQRKNVPGLTFPNGHENLPVIKGETVSVLFNYNAGDDAVITVEGNDKVANAYLNQTDAHKQHKMGYVNVTINELNDVTTQKVTVTLTSGGETTSKVITFEEIGYFDVSCPLIVPAKGAEVTLTESTNLTITGYVQASITGGSDWTTRVATYQYQIAENTSTLPRTSVVTFSFTVNGKEHSKSVQIPQMGTNPDATSYEMFLGNWKLSAYDKISGSSEPMELSVDFKKDPNNSDSYLVYGLSATSGNTPVRMVYDNATGDIEFTVPQEGLNGTLGMYRATLSGTTPVENEVSTTFRFVWNGSSLTGNMTESDSFMYMGSDGSVALGDNVFLYNVSLTRAEIPIYADGTQVCLHGHTSTSVEYPINIFILGDGYQTKDLQEKGKFQRSATSAMNTIFAYEPYKSFQERFDVFMITYASEDEGTSVENEGIVKNTRYSTVCRSNSTLVTCNYSQVLSDIRAAGHTDNEIYKSMIIVLINTDMQSGTCWQGPEGKTTDPAISGDGYQSKSIAMVPANNAFATSGLIIHEAGGHAYGRLADEYTSTSGNTFDGHTGLQNSHNQGFYWNVSPYTDSRCPWYKFTQLDAYKSAGVGFFESAYLYQYGIYRSEDTSIMINNTGKFNAISRWMIYRRIRMQSEGGGNEDTIFDDFLDYDTINL